MVVLHSGRPQPEEPWPRPPTARDLARDLGERTVTLAVEGHTVAEHRDPVRVPLPFADQDCSHLRLSNRRALRQAPSRSLFGDPREQASGRGLETAESLLLEAVGDRPNQKGPAETAWGPLTVEVLPALAEVRDSGLRKACNLLCSASAARSGASVRRFMIVSGRILQQLGRSQSPCVVLL
jgi:hypothetical protein